MELILFGMLLPWLLLGFGCWLGYQLVRQNGRILLRLEQLEALLKPQAAAPLPPEAGSAAPAPPEGLPIGSAAPDFELPDLEGVRHTLATFRGKQALLIFFNPGCGYCARMAPDLAKLPPDGAEGRPVPVVVAAGDPEATRRLAAEHGIRRQVLFQRDNQVAERYRANGTPMGYLLDEEGKIASPLTVGAAALLELADTKAPEPPVSANGHLPKVGTRDLSRSKIRRDGLEPGTAAPDFTLPCVDGGELSLSQFRGRRVLLIFSDPHCSPCDELLPELERLARASGRVEEWKSGRSGPRLLHSSALPLLRAANPHGQPGRGGGEPAESPAASPHLPGGAAEAVGSQPPLRHVRHPDCLPD
jgi:peroxiredoxin